jgi:hypothetical protein
MAARQTPVERFSIMSSRQLNEVMATIHAAVGHPAGFTEFARYDLGAVLRMETSSTALRTVRLVFSIRTE